MTHDNEPKTTYDRIEELAKNPAYSLSKTERTWHTEANGAAVSGGGVEVSFRGPAGEISIKHDDLGLREFEKTNELLVGLLKEERSA